LCTRLYLSPRSRYCNNTKNKWNKSERGNILYTHTTMSRGTYISYKYICWSSAIWSTEFAINTYEYLAYKDTYTYSSSGSPTAFKFKRYCDIHLYVCECIIIYTISISWEKYRPEPTAPIFYLLCYTQYIFDRREAHHLSIVLSASDRILILKVNCHNIILN